MRRLTRIWPARTVAVCLVLVPVFTRPADAHHSFSAEYAAERTATLTGALARLDWVNPHVWLYVDVKGPGGSVVRWAVECGAPNSMLRRGVSRDVLVVGSEVVVDGYLAKDGRPAIKGRSVRWAGSRAVYIGSPGTGAPDDPGGPAGAPAAPR